MSSKIKEEKKKNQKEKKRIESYCFALKPEQGLRGHMAKAFKGWCPRANWLGSRRLSVRYMGGMGGV